MNGIDANSGHKVHDGHRRRLKERYRRDGLDGFEPHNIMELLLFFGIPMRDTNPLAHRLLERFGSISEVLNAPYSALLSVDGVGENVATLIKLMPDIYCRAQLERLDARFYGSQPSEAGHYLVGVYINAELEFPTVLMYDSSQRLKCRVSFEAGEYSLSRISPRRITELLLERKAASFILAHNHPSGLVEPSEEDLSLTRRLSDTFATIGIPLIGHYIVAYDRFVNIIV